MIKAYRDALDRFFFNCMHACINFLYQKFKKFELNREQAVFSLLSPSYRFLDVGCGDGNLALMAKYKFKEVYGLDISRTKIEVLKKQIKNGQTHFFQHDVEQGLPFNNLFFDAVACVSVLQYIRKISDLLDEIRRVLKVGGQFIVEVPNGEGLLNRLQLFRRTYNIGNVDRNNPEIVRNFTLPSLLQLLESKGFKTVCLSSSGIFAKYRRWYPSLLSGDIIVASAR